MRLIDADVLKYKNIAEVNGILTYVLTSEEIDNAPTVCERYRSFCMVKPERPQGKWIMQTYYDGFTYWKCSNCGKKNEFEVFEFCPRCGADMQQNKK